ncbi:MAG TPA: 4-hydroxy-tetrahydrodipicolinate synthase [Defluviitoga sp.]|nr:4-hydroxy-tetrahydrodipicolinate synthase [Defluviitoga sp.]HOP24249.1 4-hydroxy-tetrahydrodipicolinate synthase [Defluviitoga sp.]HPZ28159.1 4-hydroxy-tetrahydrodipicolinate synthase [Defluviitoga sp.]HQD62049.1 4-hydroxy-tetrahydrodipicolinate synthase [Defluviitoga sp.]
MFEGVGTAMITPFNENEEVDYKSLRNFVKFQLTNKVDSLIVLGTTGEAPAVEDDERERIVNLVLEIVDGKIPVIVGTGTNNVKHVLKYNKMAERAGADGLLIVTPYYNKSTQKGLVEYYKYVAERTSLPIIIYNVPSRTGINVNPETAIEIHNVANNVIGIKEASSNISQIVELFSMKPDSFKVFSGNDDQVLPIMALGGDGVISVTSNIAPKALVELTHSLLANDLQNARKINNNYVALNKLLFREVNPIPVKYATSLLGLCKNVVRLPLVPATLETQALVKREMERLGML